MDYSNLYYEKYAAAYVRGMASLGQVQLPAVLAEKPLDWLDEGELEEILEAGKLAEIKLYRFKKNHEDLPRVKRVLGFLISIQMKNLLDVGSGRGVFLWPCLHAFPWLEVTSVDLLPYRVEMLSAVRLGGVSNLDATMGDICTFDAPDRAYDVVTMLEVLEHIPDVWTAVQSATRIAKKYIVVSVPSKPDGNPEHIHLLTKGRLTELFGQAGCERLHFDGVQGHLIMVAALS